MTELIKEIKKIKQTDMDGESFLPYKNLTEKGFINNDTLKERLNNTKDLIKKGWTIKSSINYYF
tara:strand:+ start:578 stop:769 length:192 start_codon:yes stop_codon:yes gene_type:complete